MKTLSYLTVPAVSITLLVLGCGQIAPTTPTESQVVLPQSAEVTLCCPDDFVRVIEFGSPADRNGDWWICRKVTPGGTITIDNPGGDCGCVDCCVPPCDGGGA